VLAVANAIALQKNYPILQSFMDNITACFESRVFAENFADEAHKATEEINRWVAEQTHGKIAKLFDQDLNSSTQLVLLNAIYFKGVWKTRFSKEHTIKEQFHLDEQHQSEVNMMSVLSYFHYADLADGQLIELPYQDETLAMYIFLPHMANSKKAISTLFTTESTLLEKIAHLRNQTVSVHVPKFKFDHTYQLAHTLQQLGIKEAFSKSAADFSNIDGKR